MIKWKRFAADRKRQVFAYCLAPALLAAIAFGMAPAMANAYPFPDSPGTEMQTPAGAADQWLTLCYHGQLQVAAATGETVSQLLRRLGLELGPEDRLSHSPDSFTFSGMKLRVDQVLEQQEVYAVPVPFETLYCDDPTLEEGVEQVLVEGEEGELLRTALVTYINTQEASRETLKEEMIRAPVSRIVAVGTGQFLPRRQEAGLEIGDGYIRLPTGELLTYYDTTTVRATAYTHTDEGCDLITYTGTTVRLGTVAVDPRFIPYGTRMFIVSNDGEYVYGVGVAEDCGGAIKRDRIDLYFPSYYECIQFGRRTCTIYFLG